jgi:hypothetical protein
MPLVFANNAAGTLANSISDAAVSIPLSPGDGAAFPQVSGAEYFLVTIVDALNQVEILKVTARSNDTLTVERGQEGSTARAYSAGDRVELRLTKGSLESFLQSGELDAEHPSIIKAVVYIASDADITDHGDPATAGSLAQAVAAAGSEERIIVLPGSHSYNVNTNLTVPENIVLRFGAGAVINVSQGKSLIMDGRIDAPKGLLFTGSGYVGGTLADTPALPQWFGAKADGVNDDGEALEKALVFKRVHLPLGTYLISRPLNLSGAKSVSGEAGYDGYIDWTKDFEQFSPDYDKAATIVQYKLGSHGAIFVSADNLLFENLVFRCGQSRTDDDAFLSGPSDFLTLRHCRFENLAKVVSDPSWSVSFGGMSVRGCSFFACAEVFKGVLVDSRINDNLFTSCGECISPGSGSGFNQITANRFEWNDKVLDGYQSRSCSLTGNLFDSTKDAALHLFSCEAFNITGNTFWRNGRDGASAGTRSHIHIKDAGGGRHHITGNTFLSGANDGVALPDRPKFILEMESAPALDVVFKANDNRGGCTEKPIMDTFETSLDSLHMDDLHIKGIGNPGTAGDTLSDMLKHIASAAAGPVRVHLYEDRRFTEYVSFNAGRIILRGHGNVVISDDNGQANKILALENISYGQSFGEAVGLMQADAPPSIGWWERGAVLLNSSPDPAGTVGWVCTQAGAPGTWKAFGTIAA